MTATLFSITRTQHEDCDTCEAQATEAVIMARVTGSVESAYSRGGHGARVARVTKEA